MRSWVALLSCANDFKFAHRANFCSTWGLTNNLIRKDYMYSQYKVLHIVEGGCGTVLLGSSGLPLQKIEATLNEEASKGWQVVFQVIESKRFLLFWTREAMIVTLGKN